MFMMFFLFIFVVFVFSAFLQHFHLFLQVLASQLIHVACEAVDYGFGIGLGCWDDVLDALFGLFLLVFGHDHVLEFVYLFEIVD